MIETNQNPAKILEPSVRSLDFPPATIASKFTPILNFDFPVRTLRANQIDFSLRLQSVTKLVTVGCSVIDQARKPLARSSFAFAGRTRIVSSVLSINVDSWGVAEVSLRPIGMPLPSATTISFVPLPRFVFPTQSPLFLRVKTFHPQKLHPT
jgi:hypothetical protein